jgi:hypothetical protein
MLKARHIYLLLVPDLQVSRKYVQEHVKYLVIIFLAESPAQEEDLRKPGKHIGRRRKKEAHMNQECELDPV